MSGETGHCPSCGRTFPRGSGHCPFDGTRIVAVAPPPQDSLAGRVLEGRYQIREPIAAGCIGTSYMGWQMSVSREVVIKVIHPSYSGDPNTEDRFLHAAGLAAQLVAPAIGNVYDVGRTEDGVLYVVVELVRGRPLSEYAKQRLALRRTISIAVQVCEALDAAHKMQVMHGDLKPGNIFVDDSTGRDTVKVVDFGLARALDPVMSKPDPRRAALHYTAPELLDGEPASTRGDLYALGCWVFELLVGTPPFTGTPDALAMKHRKEPPPALPPNVPAPFAAIVQRLLAKAPRDRFTSCGDLRSKLDPVLASVGGPVTDLPRTPTRDRRPASSTTPPSGTHRGDPTTPPTGPSGPFVSRTPTGRSSPSHVSRDPTGPSTPPYLPRDPTTPPTGPSGPYISRDPTGPSTPPYTIHPTTSPPTQDPAGASTPHRDPTAPFATPPPTPAPASGSRRILVIAIVAILTAAAGIAAVMLAG